MSKPTPDPKCPQCGCRAMRMSRKPTYLQTKLLPMLGYFPWECIECRAVFMAKSRGPRKKRAPHHPIPPSADAGSTA